MNIPVMIGKIAGKVKGLDWKQIFTLYSRLKFSITIVPSGVSFIKPSTYPSWMVSLFLTIFAAVIMIITSLLMVFTPLNTLFFSKTVQLSHYQVKELNLLQDKVRKLDEEVEFIKSENESLRKAILLGDTTVINKFSGKHAGGSLIYVVRELVEKMFGEKKAEVPFFRQPCSGPVSNSFKADEGHYGIDYFTAVGTPVYASGGGYVIFSDYTTNDGNMIILGHQGGYVTIYKHCQRLLKSMHQRVVQGEQIAMTGETGRLANGPHLHFEIWLNGVPLDPQKIITEI